MAPAKRSVNRATCVFLAELAAEAERYEDVVTQIKKIILAFNAQLTADERSLLSIAYKNLTNNLRNSWRIIEGLEASNQRQSRPVKEVQLIRRQKQNIERELVDVCNGIVSLLDKHLLLAAKPGEEAVFYAKMKGDYYRYLAEFAPEEDRNRYGELSHHAYKLAYKHALVTLDPLDPTRLGLALNFSVFYHDVFKSPDRACHLAKSAFDDAVLSLDPSQTPVGQTMRDSLTILQLLRDDLILWSEEM